MWPQRKGEEKSQRLAKVGHTLRGELSDILSRHVKDPRVGKLTITQVEVTPDLRHATVSVCRFLADNLTKAEMLGIEKGLQTASQFIYETLKRRLCLKAIPALHFRYDESLSLATHVWNLKAFRDLESDRQTLQEESERTESEGITS